MSGEGVTQRRRDTSLRALEFAPCWAELLLRWGEVIFGDPSHCTGMAGNGPHQLIQYLFKCFPYFVSKGMEVTSTIWVHSLDFRLLSICRKNILYEIKVININLKQSAGFLLWVLCSGLFYTQALSQNEKNCFRSGELFWQLTELNKTRIHITWTKCFKWSYFIRWHATLPMCLLC